MSYAVYVYPYCSRTGTAVFTLYEDDGDSMTHEEKAGAQFNTIELSCRTLENALIGDRTLDDLLMGQTGRTLEDALIGDRTLEDPLMGQTGRTLESALIGDRTLEDPLMGQSFGGGVRYELRASYVHHGFPSVSLSTSSDSSAAAVRSLRFLLPRTAFCAGRTTTGCGSRATGCGSSQSLWEEVTVLVDGRVVQV